MPGAMCGSKPKKDAEPKANEDTSATKNGEMSTPLKYACKCGAVKLEVTQIMAAGLCHCLSCRRAVSAPVAHLVMAAVDGHKIVQGSDCLNTHKWSDKLSMNYCNKCFQPVFQAPAGAPFIGTFGPLYEHYDQKFPKVEDCPEQIKPTMHLNYENRLYDFPDTLPKFKDFPAAFGGSDTMM